MDDLPTVARAEPGLPGTLELGAFSVSLPVADLAASRAFYEAIGFVVTGGEADEGWLVLTNGAARIGLFQGMFNRPMLTFTPGLTGRRERLAEFTDVREVQARVRAAGVEVADPVDEAGSGPASIVLTDPDGNPVLVDQYF